MNISVYACTYNSYGGHVTLTLAGDFLIRDAPSFGDALDEIEVTIHFGTDGPPRKTLESLFEEFHARLERLPTVTFRRKKRKADISFHSELLNGRDLDKSRQLSLDLFSDGCREVVESIKLLRKRIRKDDDFDFASFQTWLDQRVEQLPETIEQLTAI